MTEFLAAEDLALCMERKRRFRGISFRLRDGQCVALVGESGMGKSLLLRLFCGLDDQYEGRFLYRGEDARSLSERHWRAHRREMGILMEGVGLFSHLTLAENLAYPLLTGGEDRAALDARLGFALSRFDLQTWRDVHPQDLPSSAMRRALLARATIRDARLLICDNLFDGLDHRERGYLRATMGEGVRTKKQALIFTAHDEEDAKALGAQIVQLSPA